MLVPVALLLLGLTALAAGAEALVRGASRLAAALGVSPLVIGLTVVAWGTGAPEFAVGVGGVLAGTPDLSVGNVVGSNIANVLLILGIAGVVTPLTVSQRLVQLDVPLMIGVSVVAFVAALDGTLGRGDGLLFLTGITAYTVWAVWQSRRASPDMRVEYELEYGDGRRPRLVANAALVAVGLALLVFGSRWLVLGASQVAIAFGFSQLVVGLTVVAAGTSAPEIATSVLASWRGERDIAVGNVVGSNIFNILAVLGATATVSADGLPVPGAALSFDFPVMIATAFACLPVFFSDHLIDRWEAALFLACYAGYISYLFYSATEHDALSGFTTIMLGFVLPITALTLTIILLRALREQGAWRREE